MSTPKLCNFSICLCRRVCRDWWFLRYIKHNWSLERSILTWLFIYLYQNSSVHLDLKNYQIDMKQNILLYFNLIEHFAVATSASAGHWMALCGPPAPLVENSSSIYFFFSFLKTCWKRLPIRVPVCIDSVPVGHLAALYVWSLCGGKHPEISHSISRQHSASSSQSNTGVAFKEMTLKRAPVVYCAARV